MSKVKRDGDFIMLQIPKKDMQSMVRYLAHFVAANHDIVIDLSQKIANGDLSKQDEYVDQLIDGLDLRDWSIVLEGAEALRLCDELAETIYDEPKEGFGPVIKAEKQRHLKIVKICVECHKSFIKGESHDCSVNK